MMITKIINGSVLINGQFENTVLYLENGKIKAIGGDHPYDQTVDAKGNYVTPGFIDLHCHGGGGADFNDGNAEAVKTAVLAHLRFGTTTIYPTVTSAGIDGMERAICAIEEARKDLPSIAGIHLEGPYFSPAQTGAQSGSALKNPVKEEYGPILQNHKIIENFY